MIIKVTPIYGNGWTDGVVTVDEPLPFEIDGSQTSEGKIDGIVVTAGHPLLGQDFGASPRWVGDNLTFNCRIGPVRNASPADEKALHGYCLIS
jgi:hypothetical protein